MLVFTPLNTSNYFFVGVFSVTLSTGDIKLLKYIDMKRSSYIGAATWVGSSYGFLGIKDNIDDYVYLMFWRHYDELTATP